MSNSSLISNTLLSPYYNQGRTHKIQRISPHCIVGNFPVETIGDLFQHSEASCNYAIAKDGKICLVVDEANRSWCTSSADNDNKAVTIECSSATLEPYTFNNEVFESLCTLTADIMKRNKLDTLYWWNNPATATTYQPKSNECVVTVHRWFANKACPGDWLMNKMPDYVARVNEILGKNITVPKPEQLLYRVQVGAYSKEENSIAMAETLNARGFDTWLKMENGLYKIQVGAYSDKENAEKMLKKLQKAGYTGYVYRG